MPPTMTTRSAGWPGAASRAGGTGGRAGRGGGRTRGRSGDQDDGRNDGPGGQVGGQGSEVNCGVDGVPDLSTIIAQQLHNLLPTISQGRGQGVGRNQNCDAVNDHIRGDSGNAIEGNDHRGYTYKEFLACNPNSMMSNEMQKLETELWNHAMVGASHVAYTNRFHELARLVSHLVTLEGKKIERYVYGLAPQIRGIVVATEPKTIQKAVQLAGTLTDEALWNGSIKKNPEKGGYTGTAPKCTTCGYHHSPETPCHSCFNCNRLGHFAMDCGVVPKNVNLINARNAVARTCYECGSTDHIKLACPRINQAQRPGGNQQNQVMAVNRGQGRGNQGNQARGRAFMLGAEEARQDPNIVTGMFTLNNHYATTLFDSGVDYSFVYIISIPLLDIEPSDLGFSYEIEIASGKLVEIDKVIRWCKQEIEGHMFDINLIPFGSGSFDVIIGMDWLSGHKAEIICHEKVVRIPLLDGKVLRVLGGRTEEKIRKLMSAKAKEKKQEEIVVVRDFPKVFPDDLSGFPPV
ncbi:reverse transcriptase domain-containing protein [Tanacetum coccineum]